METVRGKGGGLVLARPADQISVGRVVRDAEGAVEPAECFSTEQSHCAIVRSCQLKGVLAEAVDAFHAVLDCYTLADITRNREVLADPELEPLLQRCAAGRATAQEPDRFGRLWEQRVRHLLLDCARDPAVFMLRPVKRHAAVAALVD